MSISNITESTFQKKVVLAAKKRGVFVAKMEAVGQRGFPDLLLVANGRSLYLELKSPKGTGTLSPLQRIMQARLCEAGAWVENAQDMGAVDLLLEKLLS